MKRSTASIPDSEPAPDDRLEASAAWDALERSDITRDAAQARWTTPAAFRRDFADECGTADKPSFVARWTTPSPLHLDCVRESQAEEHDPGS